MYNFILIIFYSLHVIVLYSLHALPQFGFKNSVWQVKFLYLPTRGETRFGQVIWLSFSKHVYNRASYKIIHFVSLKFLNLHYVTDCG